MREYEMTEEELNEIIDACKPVRYMIIGNYVPTSPQENANRAWAELGRKKGFDYLSVKPSPKGERFFFADEM